ncbi:MAG: carbamoyltransferase HypF [Acidimicrobiales bacterium]
MTATPVARGSRVERIEVTGVVQGVGFRPFVWRLATGLGLDGCVGNDAARVFVEAAGPAAALDELARRIVAEAPPLARVDSVTRRPVPSGPPGAGRGFCIVDSVTGDTPRTLVPPDTAVCDDCLAELFDPADRRYRHPFITCTNCGPRFTIITGLPYDRPATTMAGFPMCADCADEYADPGDRRYHAQPIACPNCGPSLMFGPVGSTPADRLGPATGDAAIDAARAALRAGEIVAVKGLGGYHLACDATDDDAVARLRQVKHRPDKPFAVMVADVGPARLLAQLTPEAAAQLRSPARPVVLAPATPAVLAGEALSPLVAPASPLVGVMLAYTPVHHLLLAGDMPPLVMTSANLGGQPIIHGDDDASRARLAPLADAILAHDRPIATPCDDSVVRVGGQVGAGGAGGLGLLPVRRARGYAPIPVAMPGAAGRTVLAAGAQMKNTFCLAARGQAWVSQHLGDLDDLHTLEAFDAAVTRFAAFYGVEPDVIAIDAHPGYATTGWARRRAGATPVVTVQHHHAHVAAVLAEHGADPGRPAVGLAFDGTGYGPDGTIWGGEVLVASAHGYERVAHLAPVPLPGGDAAVRNPWRVALAHLRAAGVAWTADLPPVAQMPGGPDGADGRLLARMLDTGTGCVPTTSMGRLFDAVASLAGLRHEISFEAQAAIDLESAAGAAWDEPVAAYRFGLTDQGGLTRIEVAPVIAAVVDDVRAGVPAGLVAARFHCAVADAAAAVAVAVARARRLDTVVLGGGVFQNVALTELCRRRLAAAGPDLAVLTHGVVPPNDGGLALGQAWIAAHTDPIPPQEA